MNLPTIDQLELKGKRVIVRGDLDVEIDEYLVVNDKRLRVLLPTVHKLQERDAAQIIIIGHRGRPEGNVKEELSLEPLTDWFSNNLDKDISFTKSLDNVPDNPIVLLENLRFWEGEENNDEEFAKQLSQLGDIYVNEAFGNSHREHASMVGLSRLLPHAAGLHLHQEIEQLSKVLEDPQRPLVSLLSGLKEDKLTYLEPLIQLSDTVLIGGRLPEYLGEDYKHEKVNMARLIQDKEDITLHSVEAFEAAIASAKTILLSGPMGHYEEEGHRQGTQRVLQAVANSSAYTVAGGGDTEGAIALLGLEEQFDWISIGGGAMLEFICNGTLPAIKALQ